MIPYSIAIRTLGTAGEKYERELRSILRQTVQPERVIVYIAEGYPRPEITIGKEEYVWVKKGMISQRALRYDEISTPLVMLLDDDVELAPDSAERMITAIEQNRFDCIAADTFRNQDMSLAGKAYAAITNLVFPHCSRSRWAFKVHANGSFSYNNHPRRDIYLSQSAAGPASIWRKEALLAINFEQELWLERMGFAYGDDILFFYKLHLNGFRLGVDYNSGIANLDAKTASAHFQSNLKKFYTRSFASTLIWFRICYYPSTLKWYQRLWAAIAYCFKSLWLILPHIFAVMRYRSVKVVYYYAKGIINGIKTGHSESFRQLPNFIVR